jgi:hypothetical protein
MTRGQESYIVDVAIYREKPWFGWVLYYLLNKGAVCDEIVTKQAV